MKIYRKDPLWTVKDILTTIFVMLVSVALFTYMLDRHDTPSHLTSVFMFVIVMLCVLFGHMQAHTREIIKLREELRGIKEEIQKTKT